MTSRLVLIVAVSVIPALVAHAQGDAMRIPPTRTTVSAISGDTVWIKVRPFTVSRYVYSAHHITLTRTDSGGVVHETEWRIVGDSAVAINPRRAIPVRMLLLPREQALREQRAKELMAKIGRPPS